MKDGIIKNNGTSRAMRANLPATYDEFRAAVSNGTQLLDILFNTAGWSQLPDFLNKENLLTDEVCDICGLDTTAVPNDALKTLGRFNSGLGNDYLWRKLKKTYEYSIERVDSQVVLCDGRWSSDSVELRYASSVYVDPETLSVSLQDPQVVTVSYDNYTACNVVIGKFVEINTKGTGDNGRIVLVPESSQITRGYQSSYVYPYFVQASETSILKNFGTVSTEYFGYVNSNNPSEYPEMDEDGYNYVPFGTIGGMAKIVCGSYVGNGKYGEDNPNSLLFGSDIAILIVGVANSVSGDGIFGFTFNGNSSLLGDRATNAFGNLTEFSISGNTAYWYANSAINQGNKSGTTYIYAAILV